MSFGTRGRRIGSPHRPTRGHHQPPNPPEERQQEFKERLAEQAAAPSTPIPPEDAEKQIREQLAGGSESVTDTEARSTPPIRRTSEERAAIREQERIENRKRWLESQENANNRGGRAVQSAGIVGKIKEKAAEFGEEVKKDIKEVAVGKPKPRLFYLSPTHRVDKDGILYRKSTTKPGTWVSTGQKYKFGTPRELTEDELAEDENEIRNGGRSESVNKSRAPKETGGGGDELRGAMTDPKTALTSPAGTVNSGVLGHKSSGKSGGGSGSGYDERAEKERLAAFDKQGSALYVSSGYVSGGSYKGSGYDEEKERKALAKMDKAGSALNVSSGYVSGGSYKGSGYDAEKEQERLKKIDQAGSPLSAGLNYLSAGTYRTPKPQEEPMKMDTQSSDVYSTGNFKIKYGEKKPKPIEPEQQIDLEMARLANIQARQAQIAQLQQIQAMQRSLQQSPEQPQPVVMSQPVVIQPSAEPREPASATEMLFGVKTRGAKPESLQNNKSATENFFGRSITFKPPQQKKSSGNDVTDFFGITYGVSQPTKSKKKKQEVIGEFGGKKIKHTAPDVRVYTPTNKLPETNGGFMGVFIKTAKEKTPNQQKKIHPSAAEFLFGRK